MTPLRDRAAWTALDEHYTQVRDLHLHDLFAADPSRGERLAVDGAGIYLDYSKNRVTDETLELLVQLLRRSHGLPPSALGPRRCARARPPRRRPA